MEDTCFTYIVVVGRMEMLRQYDPYWRYFRSTRDANHYFRYQKSICNNFDLHMSQSSISRSLRAVAKLIVKVKRGEIKFPSAAEEETDVKTGYVLMKIKTTT